jgi:hypothetical protein
MPSDTDMQGKEEEEKTPRYLQIRVSPDAMHIMS